MFGNSLLVFIEDKQHQALQDANQIPDSQLLKPELAGLVRRILDDYKYEVARLRPQEKTGRRINDSSIEVAIPFDGVSGSFELAPSNCEIMLGLRWRVMARTVYVTFADDDSLEDNVNKFVETTSRNLDQLRRDMESYPQQIKSHVEALVERRVTALKARNERDAKRSFPIS